MKEMLLYTLVFVLFFACSNSEKVVTKRKNQIISEVLTDSVFTIGIEGPAVNSKGDLFVVNFQKKGTIGVLKRGKKEFETFIDLPNGSVGNGIRFDSKDNMFIADYTNHNILWIENGTKEIMVLSHSDTINQPNDLTLHPNLSIGYASDPNWKEGTGNLLRFSKKGIDVIETDMGTTNGIEVSPDGNYLYVNESVQTRIWRYKINDVGELYNKQLFIKFENFGMDGMRCDDDGNLYLARYGKGVVCKISPEGKLLDEIKLHGDKPTNLTFAYQSNKVLFVTMQEKKWVEKIILP